MRGGLFSPGASFLYFSSVPSSTGVVEGRISEEPSGASEAANVIYVAHSRHPAAPFLPPLCVSAHFVTERISLPLPLDGFDTGKILTGGSSATTME
jgi:hypothetical protein